MQEYGFHNRKTARPDNGRTADDRRAYRARSAELTALSFENPKLMASISMYRDEWRRANNLATFPSFQDWLTAKRRESINPCYIT